MSSPWHNLIKSTYERTSAPFDIGIDVVVISFTDWRYILACEEIQNLEWQDKYSQCVLSYAL